MPRPFEKFASLRIVTPDRYVELARTAEVFADIDELRAYWRAAIERVHSLDPGDWAVLTDLRRAKGRNDEEFDRVMTEARRPFYGRFTHSAIVVQSLVGRLHVARSTRADEPETRIFDDPDAARRWLEER